MSPHTGITVHHHHPCRVWILRGIDILLFHLCRWVHILGSHCPSSSSLTPSPPESFDSKRPNLHITFYRTWCCTPVILLFLSHLFQEFTKANQHIYSIVKKGYISKSRDCRDHDRMDVEFTTTCAISAYHNQSFDFESHSWRGVLDTTLCDKVCQWLATGRWFSTGTAGFLHK